MRVETNDGAGCAVFAAKPLVEIAPIAVLAFLLRRTLYPAASDCSYNVRASTSGVLSTEKSVRSSESRRRADPELIDIATSDFSTAFLLFPTISFHTTSP